MHSQGTVTSIKVRRAGLPREKAYVRKNTSKSLLDTCSPVALHRVKIKTMNEFKATYKQSARASTAFLGENVNIKLQDEIDSYRL